MNQGMERTFRIFSQHFWTGRAQRLVTKLLWRTAFLKRCTVAWWWWDMVWVWTGGEIDAGVWICLELV